LQFILRQLGVSEDQLPDGRQTASSLPLILIPERQVNITLVFILVLGFIIFNPSVSIRGAQCIAKYWLK
jgi:hypothetical protein